MKPVTVETTVARPPLGVFEFLDALANHERFLDHYLVDWEFSGPRRGIGAKARARVDAPASQDHFEFEVTEAEAPSRIVERGVSSAGKRETQGTYRLEPLPDGGTRIEFELAFLQLPRSERMIPGLTRAFARRVNAKAMRRLAKLLDG
ncbi:MAG TPA: SRPBCC family protein [Solirubrobacterales bacterium]|nr:SRPBCC family protein [Solirubrobacterales bacterium]